MIRRPPRSTLFPYTSSSDLGTNHWMSSQVRPVFASAAFVDITMPRTALRNTRLPSIFGYISAFRSEEHTSELQSRRDLVCRLLLEKKKISNADNNMILHADG